MGSAKLSPEEIVEARQRIWQEWLKKDPRGALILYAEENTISPYANNFGLFCNWFVGREEEVLGWITGGDFGFDGPVLLKGWADAMVIQNPNLLVQLLPKLPAESRDGVINQLFFGPARRPELEARISRIATVTDAHDREVAWTSLLSGIVGNNPLNHYEDVFPELIARADLPPVAREAGLKVFTSRLFTTQEPGRALEDFRNLSPENQAFIAPKLLAEAKLNVSYPSSVPNALAMLAGHGDWEIIARDGAGAIDELFKSSKPNAESVSRWALELPGREETVATYRRAVAGRFREDLTTSAEWVASIPEGWHRDQAYAQLAMTADADHQNAAARDEAIGAIADPAIRRELEQWRASQAKAK